MNFSENKAKNWVDGINSAKFWNKPLFVIINRAFLVSQEKYKKIKLPFSLLIHDECHSISNKTTKKFYKWILEYIPIIYGYHKFLKSLPKTKLIKIQNDSKKSSFTKKEIQMVKYL